MDQKIDAQKVVAWLNRQWQGSKVCPICKNNNWSIGEKPVELRVFHGKGDLVLGGPIYPLVSITCKVCGHTLLFNAIVAGLLPGQQKDLGSPVKADDQSNPNKRKEDD